MVTDSPQKLSSAGAIRGASHMVSLGVGLLDKTIFGCLLALIVWTLIPYGTGEPWWEAVFECAVFVLTGLYVVEGLLSGSWRLKKLYVVLPLALITAYAFLQAVPLPAALLPAGAARRTLTIDPYQTYMTARKTLALTLFLSLLLLHVTNIKRLRWLTRIVIGAGLASALFGILRQSLHSSDSTSGFVLPYLFYGVGYAQFISANAFAYLMEMSFGLVVGLIVGGALPRGRVLIYVAVAMVMWTALVLSNSRGSILGFVCQAVFLVFVSLSWRAARRSSADRNDRRSFWPALVIRGVVVLIIVATLVVGVFWMGGQSLALKFEEKAASSDVEGVTRKEIWRSSWEVFKEHPVTGVGFGAYFLAITDRQIGSGRIRVEQVHNDYLDLALNGGVITIVLAAWFIVGVVTRVWSSFAARDAYRRAAALGAAAGIISVGVHSFVDFGLQLTGLAVVFSALIVIAIADGEGISGKRRRRRIRENPETLSGPKHGDPVKA